MCYATVWFKSWLKGNTNYNFSSHISRLPRETEFDHDNSPQIFSLHNFHNTGSTQACQLALKLHRHSEPGKNLLGLTEYAYSKRVNSMKPRLNIFMHFREAPKKGLWFFLGHICISKHWVSVRIELKFCSRLQLCYWDKVWYNPVIFISHRLTPPIFKVKTPLP